MPFKQHPTDPDKMVYVKPQYNLMWPKREWVGLTDDEVGSIEHWVMFKEAGSGPIPVLKLIAYIQAKLKEKNA